MTDIDNNTPKTRTRRMAREPGGNAAVPGGASGTAVTPKRPSKSTLVLDLLTREQGATIEQLVAATGWLPHTTRAALTSLRKKGHAVTSEKADGGIRVYRVMVA